MTYRVIVKSLTEAHDYIRIILKGKGRAVRLESGDYAVCED